MELAPGQSVVAEQEIAENLAICEIVIQRGTPSLATVEAFDAEAEAALAWEAAPESGSEPAAAFSSTAAAAVHSRGYV